MEHPKIEVLNKSIATWVEKNFVKAIMPFHVMKKEFKFSRVVHISKVWKENDHWIVEARIEYRLGDNKAKDMTFQVDGTGKVFGYNVPEPYSF